jgi:urease accessory protein
MGRLAPDLAIRRKGAGIMTTRQRFAALGLASATLSATSLPALAHHVMDGKLPQTLTQGLLSGFGHPVIGIDHLLFIIGVGLLAGLLGRKLLLPLSFIVGTLAGAIAHLSGLNIAFAEIAILASVALMAIAVIAHVSTSATLIVGLVALAGLFHGYAYAESIFGAEPTPLYAYLAGFAVIQFAIAVGAAVALEMLQRSHRALARIGLRAAGGAMAVFALVAAGQMVLGV